jgi:hypothetical protein
VKGEKISVTLAYGVHRGGGEKKIVTFFGTDVYLTASCGKYFRAKSTCGRRSFSTLILPGLAEELHPEGEIILFLQRIVRRPHNARESIKYSSKLSVYPS